MNLSMRWLKEFVDVDVNPHDYSEALTMSGSKVEGYSVEAEEITGVKVGRVLSIEKHPDADKLVVCQLDMGDDQIQIVTGASNLTVGDLVPVATDGACLPNDVKIKKGKLRGVVSQGMMCSIAELGVTLGDFPYAIEDGIFVLQEDCKPGDDVKEAIGLNDTVVEFEITSNRPDCLSVIGLARETAVTLDKPFNEHTPVVAEGDGNINDLLDVKIETPLCKRYMARVVKNIKVEPSPRWLRERLRASGVRPISNIVDITNYVMLEYGQPMHAFDHRFVDGGKIIVRQANKGEKITTLDGAERELNENMMIIADSKKPIAVAGVMGGEFSGIIEDTNTIVFESACFDGASVRTTAKALGMRTDASSRYEKGLPAELCETALDRACELITMLGAGEVVGGYIDCGDYDKEPKTVKFEPEWTNKFLGTNIEKAEMISILERLGFKVNGDIITVPYYRIDIEHKADIAEEIARIYGYNNIDDTGIRGCANGKVTESQKFERSINNSMLSLGYSQINTYSYISPKEYDMINMPNDDEMRKSVKIMNPLGEDTSLMRNTTLPSIMRILSLNYKNRNADARLYEIATEYIPLGENELPIERKVLTVGAYGKLDFYDIKGVVEETLRKMNIKEWDIVATDKEYAFHPGRTALLTIGEKKLGVIGQIHPSVCANYDIDDEIYVAMIDFNTMYENQNDERTYHSLPRFPSVTRDLAILCDIDLPVLSLKKAIISGAGPLLEKVELFDIFTGEQIEKGKKSVAYSLTLRSDSGTLNEKQSDKVITKIIAEVEKLGATLRS